MSNVPIQPDDELLSAYIDGQLSADELHAVEQWLEQDPAARAKVDELRSVSSIVQSLPKSTLPAEWTAELARRLDAVAKTTGKPEHNGHAGGMPTLSLGRSSRGWWYSGAAIAAAVAIMCYSRFMQPQAAHELAMKRPAAGEMVARDSGVAGADVSDGAETVPELRSAEAASAPAPEEMLADESLVEGPETRVARPAMAPLAELPADAATASNEAVPAGAYLIVWADVPPQALREQQINRVLADNGIQVEAQSEDWFAAAEPVRRQIAARNNVQDLELNFSDSASDRSGFGGRARSSRFSIPDNPAERVDGTSSELDQSETATEQIEGETILVEATADQIAACLADMEEDPGNYATITIEPVQPPAGAGQLEALGQVVQLQDANRSGGEASAEADIANDSIDGVLDKARPLPTRTYDFGAGQEQQASTPARARRLERPQQWYLYNSAPQSQQAAYRVRGRVRSSDAPNAPAKAISADKQEQLDNIQRLLVQQQVPATRTAAPSAAEQPLQVLFVLRNAALPAPASLAPAAEAESGEAP